MHRLLKVGIPALVGLLVFAFGYRDLAVEAAPAHPVSVLVVTREMYPGEPFNGNAVRVVKLPAAGRTRQMLRSPSQVAHRLAAVGLLPNQILYQGDLASSVVSHGLKPGQKGVVLAANLTTSGGVNPGDRVDVIGKLGKDQSLQILFTGLRVVRVLNSSAQRTKLPPAGPASGMQGTGPNIVPGGGENQVPTFVEVAVPQTMELRLAVASEYGVLLEVDGPN